jgi:hypothetical protein
METSMKFYGKSIPAIHLSIKHHHLPHSAALQQEHILKFRTPTPLETLKGQPTMAFICNPKTTAMEAPRITNNHIAKIKTHTYLIATMTQGLQMGMATIVSSQCSSDYSDNFLIVFINESIDSVN